MINDNFENAIIAGEVECSNSEIKFNFQSGTFTKPIKDKDSENFNNIEHIYILLCKLVIAYALLEEANDLNINIIYTTEELFLKMSDNIDQSVAKICSDRGNTQDLTYKIPHTQGEQDKKQDKSCFRNSITVVGDPETKKMYQSIKSQIENKINGLEIDPKLEQYLACKK
jgi:hypothetical protein